jgi:hypothetical protein
LKIGKRLFGVFVCALAGLATEGCRTEAEIETSVWRIEPHAVVVQAKVFGVNRVTVVMTDVSIDCATARGLIERDDARPPDGLQFLLTFNSSPWKPGGSAAWPSVARYDGRGAVVRGAVIPYDRDNGYNDKTWFHLNNDETWSWLAVEVLDAPRIKGEIARIRVAGSALFHPSFSTDEDGTFRLRPVDEDDPTVPFELVGDVPTTLCTDIVVP